MKVLRKAFKQELDPGLSKLVNSIDADAHLIESDIKGSCAHAQMLASSGLISKEDGSAIASGLNELKDAYASGELELKAEYEDVHMNVEKELEAKIGSAAGRLHTGRSRNDQVALDTRLFTASKIKELIKAISAVQLSLLSKAQENQDLVMPGYTHMQRAQPLLFAHSLHAFVEMLARDKERFLDALKRTEVSPLGAAALAGSSLPLDPFLSANLAGFKKVFSNSIDAVSDRDFAVEFLSCAGICSLHLSQLAETLMLWTSTEFGFVQFGDNACTASSLMPNKKNPDPVELVRGKTGAVIGDLVNLIVTLKALPLGYNRDLQESKPPIINTSSVLSECLSAITIVLDSMTVNAEAMAKAASDPMLAATDLAEYLVKAGEPFRKAHEAVSELVSYARDLNCPLSKLSLSQYKQFSGAFSENVFELFNPQLSVESKISHGSTGKEKVKAALEACRARIEAEFDIKEK